MRKIGISAIGYYLPEQKIDNLTKLVRFDINERLVKDKTGMLTVRRKRTRQDTSDLAVEAIKHLQSLADINLNEIECLVVVTQNPDGYGLPHTAAIVQSKLSLSTHCAAFDISLGCSGYVYSLSIVKSFMEANALKKGVLVTADPYSKVVNLKDKNTSLLFGDAATATLLENNGGWKIGKMDFGTDGTGAMALYVNDKRQLEMNGRAVFNFSVKMVPQSIERVLKINAFQISDVDAVILHQGSRYIVETIREKLGLSEEKVPFVAQNYGNTVSSSIPLLLAKEQLLCENRAFVLSGFGVGLSWASTIIKRVL